MPQGVLILCNIAIFGAEYLRIWGAKITHYLEYWENEWTKVEPTWQSWMVWGLTQAVWAILENLNFKTPPGPPMGPWRAQKSRICPFWRIIGMFYIKIYPNNKETHWNTSYNGICRSGAPQFSSRGSRGPLRAPGGLQKLRFYHIWQNIGMM